MTTVTHSHHGHTRNVFDVNEQTFQTEVINRSREVPVVIDFWAPWCGPCRTLGPILERLAGEARGAWVLAKVNVDENPRLAAAFRVQGIPAVKAVSDGRLVDEFTGALPESQVRAWLKRFVPERSDGLIEAAAALEATNPREAEARYRLALGEEPANPAALFGLGRLLLMRGDPEGAALLNELPVATPFYARAQTLLSATDFFNSNGAEQAALEARVASDQHDLEARYQLAAQKARAGQYAEAMDHLLKIIERNRAFRNDGARHALLALFAALGDENPLVGEYRRRLANLLF